MRDAGQQGVEYGRALGAGGNEQPEWGGEGRGGGFGSDLKDLRADRNAGDLGVAEEVGGLGKVDRGGGGKTAGKAVGEPRDGVGLIGEGRDAQKGGGKDGRTGGIAADADDDVRLELAEEMDAAEDAVGQIGEGFEAGLEGDVLELAGADELQPEARGGDEPGFEATAGADVEKIGGMVVAELAADGESGDDVAAGTAAGDGDAEGVRNGCGHAGLW